MITDRTFCPWKEFTGNLDEIMLEMDESRMIPIAAHELMKQRIEVIRKFDLYDNYLKHTWWGTYGLRDGIMYHPDGEHFKVLIDSEHLMTVKASAPIYSGGMILPEICYASLNSEEFSKKYFTNASLKKKDVLNHPVWKILARDDKKLLDAYYDATMKMRSGIRGVPSAELGEYYDTMGVLLTKHEATVAFYPFAFFGSCDRSAARYESVLGHLDSVPFIGIKPAGENMNLYCKIRTMLHPPDESNLMGY